MQPAHSTFQAGPSELPPLQCAGDPQRIQLGTVVSAIFSHHRPVHIVLCLQRSLAEARPSRQLQRTAQPIRQPNRQVIEGRMGDPINVYHRLLQQALHRFSSQAGRPEQSDRPNTPGHDHPRRLHGDAGLPQLIVMTQISIHSQCRTSSYYRFSWMYQISYSWLSFRIFISLFSYSNFWLIC